MRQYKDNESKRQSNHALFGNINTAHMHPFIFTNQQVKQNRLPDINNVWFLFCFVLCFVAVLFSFSNTTDQMYLFRVFCVC